MSSQSLSFKQAQQLVDYTQCHGIDINYVLALKNNQCFKQADSSFPLGGEPSSLNKLSYKLNKQLNEYNTYKSAQLNPH